jgi:hypothetical protein
VLAARFGRTEQQVITDRDSYFRIHLRLTQPPPSDRLWHPHGSEINQTSRHQCQGANHRPKTFLKKLGDWFAGKFCN